ncbi:hypothetical protein [Cellulomonas sp. HZM]|uniref:hypothetical protein n=1 Tax=Cellulomonas sp. HZM TaxID=1454010 RepID=UPI000493230F|nr:hypothetical protein [Cellulomonas sp. HZM]
MLLIRADHDAVLAAARSLACDAVVGPTDARGWTTVYADAEHELAARFETWVSLDDETSEPSVRVHDREDDAQGTWGDAGHETWAATQGRHRVAQLLVALLATAGAVGTGQGTGKGTAGGTADDPAVDLVAEALVDVVEHGDVGGLAAVLALPEIEPAAPAHALVAVRSREQYVRVAAMIAGPARMVDAGRGWWVLAPDGPNEPEHEDRAWELAWSVAAAVGRHDAVLYVCSSGRERVAHLMSRGGPREVAAWDASWERSVDDSAERYAALVARLGEAEHPSHTRALLRRRSAADGLGELCALLGVPRLVAELADEPAGFGAGELVERSGARRAWWTAVRTASAAGPERPAWLRLLVACLGMVVEGAVAAFLVAMAVTDGAFADASPLSRSDVWFIGVAGPVALAALAWCTVLAVRAVRDLRRTSSS